MVDALPLSLIKHVGRGERGKKFQPCQQSNYEVDRTLSLSYPCLDTGSRSEIHGSSPYPSLQGKRQCASAIVVNL
nr:hypothetical protein Q903MT_gene1350 [Picea sitchensis]